MINSFALKQPSYRQAAVLAATGLSSRNLQTYAAEPSVYQYLSFRSSPAPGQGNQRQYSIADCLLLGTFGVLRRIGVSIQNAATLANHIRAYALVTTARIGDAQKLPTWYVAWTAESQELGDCLYEFPEAELSSKLKELHAQGHAVVILAEAKSIVNGTIGTLLADQKQADD